MARRIRLITNDLKAFEAALKKEAEVRFPRYVNEVVAQITYRMYDSIVRGTPVRTGRARVNWFVTLKTPSRVTIDATQLVDDPGHWFRVTGEPMTSGERQHIEGQMDFLRKGPVGQKVFITNNLDYVMDLEEGTSMKAPAGMVQITVDWVSGAGQRRKIMMDAARVL